MFKSNKSQVKGMTTLLFGRLIFDKEGKELVKEDEKIKERKELLLQIINYRKDINNLIKNSKEKRFVKEGIWKFAGIISKDDYIYAKLGKKKKCDEMIEDGTKEDFCLTSTEKSVTSFLLIDLKKNIIVYRN